MNTYHLTSNLKKLKRNNFKNTVRFLANEGGNRPRFFRSIIMSNDEQKLDHVVSELESQGINPSDSIQKSPEVGNAVAKALNSVGITPEGVQSWLGIKECGCKKRQKFLNGVLSFLKGVPKEEN